MNLTWSILLLAGGLLLLWKSADALVAGAIGLADRLGISPLIVGLTVVAMGTSAPEAAASIAAVLKQAGGDLAVGNVYGSNIANLALVGGVIALIRPLEVKRSTLLREVPVMLGVELLLWPMFISGDLSRSGAIMLLAVFCGLIGLTVWAARRQNTQGEQIISVVSETVPRPTGSMKRLGFLVVIGLCGLAISAKMTVEGAVYIGKQIGLSEAVIGLTIMAVGTSLPELVTCVVAALKGHHDISVGNLVGSNVFNTLLVVGAAGAVRPFDVSARFAGGVDFWIMIGVSVGFAFFVVAGRRILGRIGGTSLLCAYVGYIVYLLTLGT